jgi:LPPG:FO 2-phospho-L-lactate transferase
VTLRDHVVLLAGGVGGARLAVGLVGILPPSSLTIIVNTGDDFEHWGLHISPDLDTVMYNLAGIANSETGWGLAGDTFQSLEMMARYAGPDWFRLGDRDLATSLVRTMRLGQGQSLTEVTLALSTRLGVMHPILPMSDQPVRTILDTDRGELAMQEYFVRERWQPAVRSVRYAGAEAAHPTEQVSAALDAATAIILGPSNPYLSIDPILAVPGIRERIVRSRAPCVALSPIIGGRAVKGPAAKMMAELGQEVSSFGVAKHYAGILKGIMLDTIDRDVCPSIEALDIRAVTRHTLMETPGDKIRLAGELLEWTQEFDS